jgi:hypothetical protein
LTRSGIFGRTYLIAGPEPVPLRHFFEQFAVADRRRLYVRQLPAWPLAIILRASIGLAGRRGSMPASLHSADFLLSPRAYDIGRARRELGYTPMYNTAATISRTLQDQRRRPQDSASVAAVRSCADDSR